VIIVVSGGQSRELQIENCKLKISKFAAIGCPHAFNFNTRNFFSLDNFNQELFVVVKPHRQV
jgi:hypothetical protein